jgi:hypothetical protein
MSIISSIKKSMTMNFFRGTYRDILAAYLEVENTIAKILLFQPINSGEGDSASTIKDIAHQIFADNATEEFDAITKNYVDTSLESPGVDTLCNTIVRRAIYTAALSYDEVALQTLFGSIAALNTDIVLAALDCVSVAWKNHSSIKSLYGVSKAYIGLLEASTNPEVCACICYDLANILDKSFSSLKASEPIYLGDFGEVDIGLNDAIHQLGITLRHNDNPSFSNARIRISGFLLINEHTSYRHNLVPKEEYGSRMKAWGRLLREAGNASNVYLRTKYYFILQILTVTGF